MKTFTEAAKRRVKLGSNMPNARITLAGVDISHLVLSGSVNYSGYGGGSGGGGSSVSGFSSIAGSGSSMTGGSSDVALTADLSLEAYENAPLRVDLGYGEDLLNYFVGRLTSPDDSGLPWGLGSTADAWGPFKNLADQRLPEQVDVRGLPLADAIYRLVSYCGPGAPKVEVIGGQNFVVGQTPDRSVVPDPTNPNAAWSGTSSSSTAGIFAAFSPVMDAVNALCASANFVSSDRPEGVKLFFPKPKAGQTENRKASFDEGDYPPQGFKVASNAGRYFAKVAVYRQNQDGSFAFPPVVLPVETEGRYKAPPNRIYPVSDFAGDAAAALQVGADLARQLATGTYGFELDGVSPDPGFYLFDTLGARTMEKRYEGGKTPERYMVDYAGPVDGQITVDLGPGPLATSYKGYEALKVREKKLAKPFYVRRPSPYIVASYGAEAGRPFRDEFGVYIDTDIPASWYGIDEGGFWLDTALAGPYGGEDSEGSYLEVS